ncbi:MAG: outer membrane protein [Agrobacterium sp.]|nr:outer membrane protein [Agrobacterium sp.]
MLKQSFLALVALGLVSGAAIAADAVSDVPVAPVATEAAPAFSWGGFYAGASAGYGWDRVKASAFDETETGKFDGARFSGFVGYNFEVAPSVILGVEGDLGYDWANKTVDDDKISTGLNGSARLRAGYAIDRALIYTAGGYTATDSEVDAGSYGKSSKVTHGWTIGAGIDYAFTDKVFGRVEYRYNDFAEGNYSIAGETFRGDLNNHVVNVGLGVKF